MIFLVAYLGNLLIIYLVMKSLCNDITHQVAQIKHDTYNMVNERNNQLIFELTREHVIKPRPERKP